MTAHSSVLTTAELADALTALPDWRTRQGGLHTVYKAESSHAAVELLYAIGQLANTMDHHPDVDWRYDHVFVRTSTHSAGSKVTGKDIELAEAISRAAGDAHAAPDLFRNVEIGVDTADPAAVRPVWQEVLGYKAVGEVALVDPWSRGPTVWFQTTPTPDSSRLHLDVWVEDDTADAVVAGSETAGARRLDDRFRPGFTVIGDADGNRLCVCTNLTREV